jgi:hypothetical protein
MIYIEFLSLLIRFLIYVNYPVSGFHSVFPIGMFKYSGFFNFGHFNIVVFTPLPLIVVFDKRVVMATFSWTIMYANRVKNVLISFQMAKCFANVAPVFSNLVLKLVHLLVYLVTVVHHCFLKSSLHLEGLQKWTVRGNVTKSFLVFGFYFGQLALVLHFEELSWGVEHFAKVLFIWTKLFVLLQTFF